MSRAFNDDFVARLEAARPGIDDRVVSNYVDRAIWFKELIGAERGDLASFRPPPYATFGDNLRYAYYVGLQTLYSSRKPR